MMTKPTFADKFPELNIFKPLLCHNPLRIPEGVRDYCSYCNMTHDCTVEFVRFILEKHCLSKNRVREAIEKLAKEAEIASGHSINYEDLLKELGLLEKEEFIIGFDKAIEGKDRTVINGKLQ